ncbi:hypothetical protein C6W88_04620 [Halomonas litopenaei]|uniref:Uncharacterized protein n=1 Tax=Halomonas litopenaei TaxID=2109328 RepID=A0ABX5J2W1_9GAMM|nr:hypothetical protein C6W89_00545 [Halomonas sp. SYSU XM8]PTL95737.1 hypothetical protein C6W88_04620 [Halomonas litopenaei]
MIDVSQERVIDRGLKGAAELRGALTVAMDSASPSRWFIATRHVSGVALLRVASACSVKISTWPGMRVIQVSAFNEVS